MNNALLASALLISMGSAITAQDRMLENFDGKSSNYEFYCGTDQDEKGKSVGTKSIIGTDNHQLLFTYSLNKGSYEWEPYASVDMGIWNKLDASEYEGFRYRYRGAKHAIAVMTDEIKDYCWYESTQPATDGWKTVTVSFKNDLFQPTWGVSVPFSAKNLKGFSWRVNGETGDSGTIEIDDIELLKTVPFVKKNDMELSPAQIPDRIAIPQAMAKPTALHKRVDTWLSRGVCLHNWLEEDEKWDGKFEYNKASIAKYASQGFNAIRLPIDLDRWVNGRDSVVAGTKQFSVNPELFAILDSFVNWTNEYKMSLTIDYHQYDKSLNVKTAMDPGYKTMTANLWKSVASYYAKNKRDNIFYELTNEPGIMDDIANSVWRDMAKEMLDSIRTVDTFHSVIYGDSRWYDIDKMIYSDRFAPEDGNIVYAFHFYEPFIFTHQGASWTGMERTKNIPFPYDSKKWSTSMSDFGVTESTEEWIKDGFKEYYKTGNANALYNAVAEAKIWSIQNGVPVVCNEFGAHEPGDLQSRANFFNTMGSIFKELNIGYAVWFGLFDEKENLIPGVGSSMGLISVSK